MIFDTYIRCAKTTNLEAIRSSVNHQNSSFLHLHRSLNRLMKSLIPNFLFLFVILYGNSCDGQVQSAGFISVLLLKLAVI